MRISEVVTTPLWIPYKQPYHWAHGVTLGAGVVLVEVRTDEGVTGYGESIATPSAEAICTYLSLAADLCIGRSPFENARLMGEAYHALFELKGTCSAPRFACQVMAGLEMALWDVMGKATGRPVRQLLGGAVHDEVQYFGFPRGKTAQEVANEAKRLADAGREPHRRCGGSERLHAAGGPSRLSSERRRLARHRLERDRRALALLQGR